MIESRRILVPGAGGFFGGWILDALERAGHRVTGLGRDELDLSDPAAVGETVGKAAPEVIVNAVGISSPRTCREDPAACFTANTGAVLNLLEAIRTRAPESRLVALSSAAVYGPGTGEPLVERDPLTPHSIYGSSKLAAEVLVGQYAREGKVSATTLRVFNLVGPGQPADQAAAEFALATGIALREGRSEASITVGDPEIARDFTDVRDAARAVAAAIETPGRFNLCTGSAVSLRDLATALTGIARRQDPYFEVKLDPDPARIVPGDARVLSGAPDRLREATGWVPEITLRQSLADLLSSGQDGDIHGSE